MGGLRRKIVRPKAGVGQNGGACCQLAHVRRSQFVGASHGAGSFVGIRLIMARQGWAAGVAAHVIHGRSDMDFYILGRVGGEGMGEIFHDKETISAPDHAQPDCVVSRVEQVRAMGRGEHEMFVTALGAVIERNVFSSLVELEACSPREPLHQRRLTGELVRKLIGFEHGLGMSAGSGGQARVEDEPGGSSSLSRLVSEL